MHELDTEAIVNEGAALIDEVVLVVQHFILLTLFKHLQPFLILIIELLIAIDVRVYATEF